MESFLWKTFGHMRMLVATRRLLHRGLRGHIHPCAAVPGLAWASSRGEPKRLRLTLCSDLVFGFPPVGREKVNGLRPVQEPVGRFNRLTSNGTAYKPGCNEVFQRERKLIFTNRLDYPFVNVVIYERFKRESALDGA
jgi:hypothetical protein